MFDVSFLFRTFFLLWKAVPVTLLITVISLVSGVVLGFLIALSRVHKVKVLSQFSAVFVSFIRGTPIVLQIMVVYSIVPSFLNGIFIAAGSKVNVFELNPIYYAFIVFGLNNAAILSEVFRSALLTVSKGQLEAGYTSGLTYWQTYRMIIIPQALTVAIPNLCNATVSLIKNTSLAFMMTVKDVTAVAKIEASYGYNYIESYLDIFVIYIIICSAVQVLFRKWEKKQADYKKVSRA
ncbi:amino acid ABC transporter permease [Treponema sp.]|uniref:amino acid ABC transporter permease n=1 Tax=Treponema sp. TaxID=166 RepID=UPI002A803554|nr:amino acid ABC transporter permease [Treponema sp.]MCI6441440.1 amino acid ABC transporter permease [Spirochaetia bacterium]MDY4133609.1 amino acid ABC transporter permease [Treponema sp.]